MRGYLVVQRGTFQLLGNWWTPVCEIAQAEANTRGGIAVGASFLAARTGSDLTRSLPSFGHQPDNNRPPKPDYIETVRAQIRAYETHRLETRRVA